MVKAPGVITGRSGTIGKVAYTDEKFWPLNTALYVKDFHDNNAKYVKYFIEAFHLERFSTGTGVPTLNRNIVHKEKVNIPPINEQERIVEILSAMDDAIDSINQRKNNYLKLRSNVFSHLWGSGSMSFNEMNTIENALRDHLVGKPVTIQTGMVAEETAEYIADYKDLKWKYVHGENLVLYGKQPQDVFVDTWLKDALCRLNKPLAANPDLADEVIHRLRGVLLEAGYSGLIRANEIFQDWLLGRISMPLGKDGEHITIHLLDFDTPHNNHFVVSRQVQFTGTRDCYFDLVLYVNGLPLVVGEVKTPVWDAISWQDGAADFLGGGKHYWGNQKAFFVPNLLCFASEGKTFYYGAVGARFKNWAPWHSTEEREEIPQDMRTVLKSAERLLHPKTLLEILQSFVVFSTVKQGEGKPSFKIKILPRYSQYEAAKAIVGRVKTQDARQGLIWHFQGSGKSLLMLFAAQMLKADPDLKNPTVVVVVDRVDLDSQINSVFNNASTKNVTPVKSCKALAQELKQDSRQILITTVFKFDEVEIDEHNTDGLNPRDNIIVLVDEAHRTQEGSLGEKMRWALPNAFFFGLTGTPISGLERNTFKLFGAPGDPGRYLNRYFWESLGPETIKLIHENTEIDRIRDDIDELVMDAESVFELTDEERKKKAKKLNLSLMVKVHSKNDPRFEELGWRLERLKDKYEAGVLSSLDWLKELLDAAREMVRLENETHEEVIPDDKQALTEIFLELRNGTTPQIIANVVEDIDKIVRVTRFDGWQSTHAGQKEIQKVLRQTLYKYKLHKSRNFLKKHIGIYENTIKELAGF